MISEFSDAWTIQIVFCFPKVFLRAESKKRTWIQDREPQDTRPKTHDPRPRTSGPITQDLGPGTTTLNGSVYLGL